MDQNHSIQTSSRYNQIRKRFYPFFWFLAAADETLLFRCPIPEQDKQAGIGMAVLCTTIAAVISSYYAIHSLFDNLLLSFPLALFWGVIIFNLDRFMVGSMRKDKQKRIWKELLVASPRIFLACLIAVLISKPLEVRIFQNQIDAKTMSFNGEQKDGEVKLSALNLAGVKSERDLSAENLQKIQQQSSEVDNDPLYRVAKNNYSSCLKDQAIIDNEIAQKKAQRRILVNTNDQLGENDGNIKRIDREIQVLINRIKALGCFQKKQIMNKKAEEYLLSQAEILKTAKKRTDSLNRYYDGKATIFDTLNNEVYKKVNKASTDILGQLRILDKLKEQDTQIYWASLLITALFFILEIAPLSVKILSPRGEYDSMIHLSECFAFDREDALIEESRQEKLARQQTAAGDFTVVADIDEQVKIKVREKVLEAQADLADKIIDAWKTQEESELKTNPQSYLKFRTT